MEELLIPNPSLHDVSSYTIMVAGNEVNPAFQLLSLSIIKEVNRVPSATLVFRDGEAAERTFAVSDSEDFVPGKEITISMGRDGDNSRVFAGLIVKHSIKVRENGEGELRVECRDKAVKMTLGRQSKYFENIKDNEVFDELIQAYGLESEPDTTTLTHQELVQHHVSDWDFMLLRAEANSLLVLVDDGKIKIVKPKTDGDPVLQVAYGSSILEMEACIDSRTQWKKVQARSWDYSNQDLFQADTENADFQEPGNLDGEVLAEDMAPDEYEMHHSGHLLEQELQDWVDAIMLRSRLAKVRGRAKFKGFAAVKPGDLIELTGVGERFTGKVYVTAVKQDMGAGMWDTHVQFGLDPTRYAYLHKDLPDPISSGLVGGIQGLQIGKVVQLQDDPDGQDRILIKIPTIDNQAQGIWTRVASLDAGDERGYFFRPEIDDEVIVGFINDDPREAVMLGMLHSSAHPAHITAQDVNHEKGLQTRSKLKMHYNDDTKTIIFETPAGNRITMDESGSTVIIEDQNSNKMTMESSGIIIESPQNIEVKAGVNLTMEAAAAVTVKGATITLEASGSLEAKGAITKMEAQGIAELKGSLVKIN